MIPAAHGRFKMAMAGGVHAFLHSDGALVPQSAGERGPHHPGRRAPEMLRRIREARLDFRTGIIVIVLALIMWGVVTWVRIRDFVPDEFKEPQGDTPVRVP